MASIVFPGTFDPPTYGHLDVLTRASRAFDRVYVLVAVNPSKEPLLTLEERRFLLEGLAKDLPNVEILIWEGFIVDFMQEKGINLIARGIRGLQDFGAEFEMHLVNRSLDSSIDTVWFPAGSDHMEISSSMVKMLFENSKKLSSFVPPLVADYLETQKKGKVSKP